MPTSQELIAQGLALRIKEIVVEKSHVGRFGVLVTSVPNFDAAFFIQEIGKLINGNHKLRLAMAGFGDDESLWNIAQAAGFNEDTFATNLLAAGRWRNMPDAEEIPIAIARGEQPTLHTLAAFTSITSAEVALSLLKWAEEDSNVSVNAQHSNFFRALADEVFAELHNPLNIANYLAALLQYNRSERPDAIRELLPSLGLLRDPEIFSTKDSSRAQLEKNLDCCRQIRRFTHSDLQAIKTKLKRFPSDLRLQLEQTLGILDVYQRTFDPNEFGKLTLREVLDLILLKPPKQSAKKELPPDQEPTDGEVLTGIEDDETSEIASEKDIHRTFAEALLDADEDKKQHLVNAVEEAVSTQDVKSDPHYITVNADAIDLEARLVRDDKLLEFVHSFCSEECWGGTFQTEQGTLRAAIDRYNHIKVPLSPFTAADATDNGASLVEFLGRLDQGLSEPLLLPAFERMHKARQELLPLLDQIVLAPLETIGSTPERFNQFQEYINASNALLQVVRDNYEAIDRVSSIALRICIARILALDAVLAKVHVERSFANKAILMPLHPLHLWKYVRLIEILQSRDDLAEGDRAAVIEETANERHFLSTLYISEILTDGQPITLPFAGSIGSLPCYENTSNHYSGSDGLSRLFYTLDRFVAFYPLFIRPLRVTIVDVPSLSDLLAEVDRFLKKKRLGLRVLNIDLRLYFTRESISRNYLSSLTSGENERIYQEHVSTGRLNLRIQSEPASFDQILDAHKECPAHLIALFDQSELAVRPFQRQEFFADSPFVITREYQYDQAMDEFSVHPVNDALIFSHYNDLVNRLRRNLQGYSAGVIGKTQTFRNQLDEMLQGHRTQWLFIADRILPSENRLASPRIYAKREGRREVLVLASTSEHFARELELLLKNYNFHTQREQLEELLRDFSRMIGDGLLPLVQEKDGALTTGKALGLIGLLVAARAYNQAYPDSLIVAVDNENARQWLWITDTKKRADLIGIRQSEPAKFVIEAIEVKTFENEEDVISKRNGLVEGKAVVQVLAVRAAIEQAFTLLDSPFAAPRQQILRDLLYTECQSRRYNRDFRLRWSQNLKNIFTPETSVEIAARIYQIDLRHNKTGGPEKLRADIGNGNTAEILFVPLGERQVQKLLTGIEPMEDIPPTEDTPPNPEGDPGPSPRTPSGSGTRPRHAPSAPSSDHLPSQPSESAETAHSADSSSIANTVDQAWLKRVRDAFVHACEYYNIKVTRCEVNEAIVGLSIIRFPFQLARGTRKEKLDRNIEDIGREIAISNLMIQSLPNSQYLALDVPHPERRTPLFVVDGRNSLPQIQTIEELPLAIGVSPEGQVRILDLKRYVHMLVGGTTGAGKTVFLYSVISSLLWTHQRADDLELVLSSSKLEDFSFFEGLPHLYGRTILTDAADAIEVVGEIARQELERREGILSARRVRSVEDYNKLVEPEQRLRPIVVIVDEFADLADQVSRDREAKAELYTNIRRIAQIGRSRSVHLVLCTQRPTADLFPSNIKTLMNVRIAFRMNSQVDSRTILDESGAEKLLGQGDMLFKAEGAPERLQGFLVRTSDITNQS